jgi:lipopolysaccharide transport system ATP-binding protein
MSTVIKVENLSKQYRLGQVGTGTISHDVNRWWHKIRGKEDPYLKIGESNDRTVKGDSDYVWALKDINFEVNQGEVLGIIGRNGAGKSTLLKILSRTTAPTTGSVKIKGRVASLLEVGTGFHPELSGRENIFLNGAIMGMSKHEIAQKFDEIVAFSGVERYIDTPVKRYSSGMYVRLAFAVAANLEPDILIVDEVLAVGDAEFQKKCLGKMKDVSEKDGRTVLFVSHQLDAITRLCNRALLFTNGQLIHDGAVDSAIRLYHNKLNDSVAFRSRGKVRPGSEKVKLNSVLLREKDGHETGIVDISKAFEIVMEYEVLSDDEMLTSGINIFNEDGDYLFTSHDVKNATSHIKLKKGIYESAVIIPGNFLAEGLMTVSVSIMSYDPFIVHFHEVDLLSFSVYDNQGGNTARGIYAGKFPGLVRPLLSWETIKK